MAHFSFLLLWSPKQILVSILDVPYIYLQEKMDAYMTNSPNTFRSGVQYIWPGLEPNAENYVFQDVAGDQSGNGIWNFVEWAVDSR